MPSAIDRLGGLRLALLAAMPIGVGCLALAVGSVGTVATADAMASAMLDVRGVESLVAASFAVTELGATDTVLPLTAVCAALLLAFRRFGGALALVVSVALTQLVVDVVKETVSRPRPPANEALADASGFSFPSGHSATSAALFGVLTLIAIRHARGSCRAAAAAAGVVLIAGVGASRVLLGAHYPTDVLAGWLTGGTVAVASVAVARCASRRAAR